MIGAQWSICFIGASLSSSFPGQQLLWQKRAGEEVSEEAAVDNSDKNIYIWSYYLLRIVVITAGSKNSLEIWLRAG